MRGAAATTGRRVAVPSALGRRPAFVWIMAEVVCYDTAGILGIPVGTVRSRLSRGGDALRKLLDMDERRSSVALQAA